jgi:hypothetical protein
VSSAPKSRWVAFDAKIRQASSILESLNLLELYLPCRSYVDVPRAVRDSAGYRDEWSYYDSKSLLDFKLVDGSILQFKDTPSARNELSFCYFECPLAVDSYATFLTSTFGCTIDEVGDMARDEYEEYLSSADLKRAVTMIRYDYSPALYREGRHPASHIHIGHGTEIRIATTRIMNPISFTLFVLRQAYPTHWATLIESADGAEHVKHVRGALDDVAAQFIGPKDLWEVRLD